MKRVGALVGMVTLSVLVVGMNVYAQQQRPSSQEQAPERKTSERETTTDAKTSSDTSAQQEKQVSASQVQRHASAETASTLQGVMLASDTIVGASVKNEQGRAVGEIQRLHISPTYGVILYAELSVGGFLGMGEKTIMVPWKAIKIARSGDSLVLNTSKQLLHKTAE